MVKKLLTLVVVYKEDKILLGMKKRGFGKGLWNGFGGKPHEGETLKETVTREVFEEANIVPLDLRERGTLNFSVENEDEVLEVHLFSICNFTGEIKESEEMKPEWFSQSNIPYENMWPDDPYWLPLILSGKGVECKFLFDKNNKILEKEVKEL